MVAVFPPLREFIAKPHYTTFFPGDYFSIRFVHFTSLQTIAIMCSHVLTYLSLETRSTTVQTTFIPIFGINAISAVPSLCKMSFQVVNWN